MDKPKPKREIGISLVDRQSRVIFFTATGDALKDVTEFGRVSYPAGCDFLLAVDPRYDFDEVLEYMQSYDKQIALDSEVWGAGQESEQ